MVIGNGATRRRSLLLTAVFGVLAVIVLDLAFSQSTLTAPMPDTVDMADMTWVEIRSAIEHGYTVAIVPSGGIEQNGAHMVLGKHDYIVRSAADRIAHELGRTLVTPVVSFVPEGNYNPPSDNMPFPGTLGVPNRCSPRCLKELREASSRQASRPSALSETMAVTRPRKLKSRRSSI